MRIGIVSPWYERGIAIISLNMHQALSKRHDVFVLGKPGTPQAMSKEFHVPNLEYSHEFKMPVNWALKHKLDLLIFNERMDLNNIRAVREAGFKTVGFMEWEMLPPNRFEEINSAYSAIIAPHQSAYDQFVKFGVENVILAHWGTDLKLFKPRKKNPFDWTGPISFFQPSNFGGVYGRKNVSATNKAWGMSRVDGNGKLYVHRQQRDTWTRDMMAKAYRNHLVVLLPSMWEGLGLCFIEAIASGCAIITTDAPPMSDYVVHGENGLICETKILDSPRDIYVPKAVIDIDDYADCIKQMTDYPTHTVEMGMKSREMAEAYFDWNINGEKFVEAIECIA